MVVVLIIGIRIAIALPTFLGARERAQNRATQSSLRNELVAAKTAYIDDGSYVGATTTGLMAIDPSLSYAAAGVDSTGPNNGNLQISTVGTTNDTWSAAALSDSGTCYWINDVATGPGTTYGDDGRCLLGR